MKPLMVPISNLQHKLFKLQLPLDSEDSDKMGIPVYMTFLMGQIHCMLI